MLPPYVMAIQSTLLQNGVAAAALQGRWSSADPRQVSGRASARYVVEIALHEPLQRVHVTMERRWLPSSDRSKLRSTMPAISSSGWSGLKQAICYLQARAGARTPRPSALPDDEHGGAGDDRDRIDENLSDF
jgi:hypothetical protein